MRIINSIKRIIFRNKNYRYFKAASILEKKAIELNLRSEEYLKLAKKISLKWKKE